MCLIPSTERVRLLPLSLVVVVLVLPKVPVGLDVGQLGGGNVAPPHALVSLLQLEKHLGTGRYGRERERLGMRERIGMRDER